MKNYNFKKKLIVLNKKNVALIGHMGSGKSILGQTIAKKLNINHIDTDLEISKFENSTINDIFLSKGENYFRDLESTIVTKSLDQNNAVISLGGGSVLNKQIREKLNYSITVFLDVNLNELNKRLAHSYKRPLIKNTNIFSKLKELDTQRIKYYLKADIRIQNVNSISESYLNFIEKFSKLNDQNNKN